MLLVVAAAPLLMEAWLDATLGWRLAGLDIMLLQKQICSDKQGSKDCKNVTHSL